MRPSMFEFDPDFTERVLTYCRNRLALQPVPLDFGSLGVHPEEVLPDLITSSGRSPHEVLDLFESQLAELVISTDSPRFLAFIPNAPTKDALLFDMVVACSGLNGTSWLESAGAVLAENQVIKFLASRAGMPEGSGGVFVSGGTIANLSALTVARDFGLRRHHVEGRSAVLVSAEAHSSVASALHILGMDAVVIEGSDHRLCREDVERTFRSDPRARNIVAIVATAGTTNAGIIEDLEGLGLFAREREIWFHVDGAYGGAGILSERLAPRLTGIRHADSFVVDPHKWLFAPLDCAGLIFRNPQLARAVHTQKAGYLDALHLEDGPLEWNPSDFAIHLSRRPRGLALWFSLVTNGTDAYAAAIDRGVDLATYAAQKISHSKSLRLIREPELTNVLFEREGWEEKDYRRWSHELLREQIAFVAPSTWKGRACGRFSFLHPQLSNSEVSRIIRHLEKFDSSV